jgi:hypothetical protein
MRGRNTFVALRSNRASASMAGMRRGFWKGWWLFAGVVWGCGTPPLTASPAAPRPQAAPNVAPEPPKAEDDAPELEQLARARDPQGVQLAAKALGSPDPARRMLGARALVGYGAAARDAQAALLLSLANEPPGELSGTMAWVLLELDTEQGAREVLARLSDGSLLLASNLERAPVFEVARLRQYAARFRNDKATYEPYLYALGARLGGAEVVAELSGVSADPRQAFFQQKLIFDVIAWLGDPGAAGALYEVTQKQPAVYFETRAAHALASVGDLRAAPLLARRLKLDPLKVYSDERDWEMMLKRDDNERVVSARLLADLAVLHPEAHAQLIRETEASLWAWLTERPSPHANGLRALAAMGSRKHIAQLRRWANPPTGLPKEGQQPPMPEEWVIAQVGLRYVGALRDGPSRPVLLKSLQRRPRELDVTMDGLMQGGVAILGMSLRALGVGAAHGLSEWRDPAAFAPLLRYVESARDNEQSRCMAGEALGWVGNDRDLQQLAERLVLRAAKSPLDKTEHIFLSCAFEAFQQRPVPSAVPSLLALLDPTIDTQVRHAAARGLGRTALDASAEHRLLQLLGQRELRSAAAVALMLGGSSKAAATAFSTHMTTEGANNEELLSLWYDSFGFWSREDVANGTLFRWVENAAAMRALSLQGREKKPEQLLRRALANLVYDNGPHSATRVVLVRQLRQVATGKDERLARQALDALVLLDQVGVLLDLARTGPHSPVARAAHQRALTEGRLPAATTAKDWP